MKKIINCETGEEIVRELTAEELAQQEIDEKAREAELVEIAKKEAAKNELLERLGITNDELAVLLS